VGQLIDQDKKPESGLSVYLAPSEREKAAEVELKHYQKVTDYNSNFNYD